MFRGVLQWLFHLLRSRGFSCCSMPAVRQSARQRVRSPAQDRLPRISADELTAPQLHPTACFAMAAAAGVAQRHFVATEALRQANVDNRRRDMRNIRELLLLVRPRMTASTGVASDLYRWQYPFLDFRIPICRSHTVQDMHTSNVTVGQAKGPIGNSRPSPADVR